MTELASKRFLQMLQLLRCAKRFQGFTHASNASHRGAATALFDKNSSRTTPCVSIFRQINFCDSSVTISERTNALDRVESNVRNVLCTQPFQEETALKRDRQCAKLYDGEVGICRIL